MNVTRVGLDLAKDVFQVHGVDRHDRVVVRRRLKRSQVAEFFSQLEPCVVGMEACAGAHYWAGELGMLGHTVRMMAPQFVKPYVKSQKNDANDAEAICEAAGRANMRFVKPKNQEQRQRQAVHRVRSQLVKSRTALANELRSFLIETVGKTGGHFSSNLGTVELTVALHYVFNTPEDRLVWDVGHQTYPHKILTGRRDLMPGLRQFGGISGFPRMSESEYDAFGVGHSSTSISAALGMAIASKLKGEDKQMVAIIGDGSITGGIRIECHRYTVTGGGVHEAAIAAAVAGAVKSGALTLQGEVPVFVVEPTREAAQSSFRELQDLLHPELGVALLSRRIGHDLWFATEVGVDAWNHGKCCGINCSHRP